MRPLKIVLDEQIAAFSRFEEPQIECELCTRARRFELVEQFLIVNGLRSFRERALLIDIFDPARQSLGCHFTFIEAAPRFDLARQPVRGRQDGSLAQ